MKRPLLAKLLKEVRPDKQCRDYGFEEGQFLPPVHELADMFERLLERISELEEELIP